MIGPGLKLPLNFISTLPNGLAPHVQCKGWVASLNRGSGMGIFLHAAAIEPFICLFLLGKLTLGGYGKFAQARRHAYVPSQHLCK
jgi:hypothetical protein